MEEVINFHGNCVFKTSSSYIPSEVEKDFISNLEYQNIKDNLHYVSKNVNVLDNSTCNNLANMLDNYADYYIKNLLEIDHKLKRLNSWVTINKKGSFHDIHKHTNTFISVCFYPQIKEGGIIFTSSPLISSKTNLNFKNIKDNIFNCNKLNMKISPNDIIIFPGWLNHTGEENTHDLDRVMIGVNYFITGNLGTNNSVNNLNL